METFFATLPKDLCKMFIKEKLQALTVFQVCKRTGVSRMAFYRNFKGLEQILYEYCQPKIGAMFDTIRENPQFSDLKNFAILCINLC